MSDLIPKVHETLAGMNTEEQTAYSLGLAHAYSHVFDVFQGAFTNSTDMHDVLQTLSASWEYVRATQVVRGVL